MLLVSASSSSLALALFSRLLRFHRGAASLAEKKSLGETERISPWKRLSLSLSLEERTVIYTSVKLLPVTSATTRGAYGTEVAFFFNLVKLESAVPSTAS